MLMVLKKSQNRASRILRLVQMFWSVCQTNESCKIKYLRSVKNFSYNRQSSVQSYQGLKWWISLKFNNDP